MVTDSPDAETAPVTPRTTSLNEPDFRAADVAGGPATALEGAAAVAPGAGAEEDTTGLRPHIGILREPSSAYSLIRPASYDNIVGGSAPSPFVSLLTLMGLGGLVASAVATAAGIATPEWWLFALLFLVLSTLLAGFISRSA